MKLNKQSLGIGIAALVMIGIVAGVVIYIVMRELRETLTRTNPSNAPASKGENMHIEHSSSYNQSARGYRNNNPLNLRMSSNQWKGKVPASENTDGAFEQFTSMAYGFRAALKNLRSYISKYRCDTIQSIVNKWAPASDGNNPTTYAARVAQTTGYAVTSKIAVTDKEKLCRIAYAMAIVENGSAPVMTDIYAGWDLM